MTPSFSLCLGALGGRAAGVGVQLDTTKAVLLLHEPSRAGRWASGPGTGQPQGQQLLSKQVEMVRPQPGHEAKKDQGALK